MSQPATSRTSASLIHTKETDLVDVFIAILLEHELLNASSVRAADLANAIKRKAALLDHQGDGLSSS